MADRNRPPESQEKERFWRLGQLTALCEVHDEIYFRRWKFEDEEEELKEFVVKGLSRLRELE